MEVGREKIQGLGMCVDTCKGNKKCNGGYIGNKYQWRKNCSTWNIKARERNKSIGKRLNRIMENRMGWG